ncbi:MAG TPA: gephyrin-like molybdotransferase Glp [Edaphobacter sp.]|nr:gephyrin-like molybdotransferase Glp [Edaphobacter sp.]
MNVGEMIFDFDGALKTVLLHASGLQKREAQAMPLMECAGRVLAEPVFTTRDQPPFNRSTRDGFAVRTSELKVPLRVVGQIRAGERWQTGPMESGCAIEIMTGAPVPDGADAVVMVEHVAQKDSTICITEGRTLRAGENIVPQGSEARAGQAVLAAGAKIEAAEMALAAACGCSRLTVFCRPKAAIVATGDELVELGETPDEQQIWNSNSYALAALVTESGGDAVRMPIARDRRDSLEKTIVQAREQSDLLLLSGGVSMGKYDLVEEVLHSMGAEFFFTGVKMQPGKPVVFGRLPASGSLPAQFFFGLPGNPVSTQVTFHCFVAPMLRAMAGAAIPSPRFAQATLAEDVAGKPGLTRVLPARLSYDRVRPEVQIVAWQGSGDLAANARANCYAVLPPEQERFMAGDVTTILLR